MASSKYVPPVIFVNESFGLITAVLILMVCCTKSDGDKQITGSVSINSWEMLTEVNGIGFDRAFTLHIDNEGILWVGTFGNGLIQVGNAASQHSTANSDISNDTVLDLTSDQNGILWGGTPDGLFRFEGTSFTNFNSRNSPMLVDYVGAINMDDTGHLWFGNGNAEEGGLMRYDQAAVWTLFTPQNSSLPNGIILDIMVDGANGIWTGHGMFQGQGGLWHRSASGSENIYTTSNSNLKSNWINQLDIDRSGRLWVGSNAPIYLDGVTLHGGLQQLEGGVFVDFQPTDSGKNTNRVEALAVDDYDIIWVSTGLDAPTFPYHYEVAILEQGKWRVLSDELEGFPQMWISDIVTRGDDVWMAAAEGLLHLNVTYSLD